MLFESSAFVGTVLFFTSITTAHYTLQIPSPIGPYNDVDLVNGPCDGYDPTTVTTFQDYPWSGQGWGIITTHPKVIWEFNVALFRTVTKSQSSFIPMTEKIQQNTGTGFLCLGQVPGKKEWVGQKAIIQVIQNAPDGALTACAAVVFTDGPPASGGSNCFNNSGPANLPYDIAWLPGTGSDLNVETSSSSSTSAPTSTTKTSGSSAQTSTTTGGSGTTTSGVKDSSSSLGSKAGSTTTTPSGSLSTTASVTSTSKTSLATTASGISNSTKATGTSTASPPVFTGSSYKTEVGYVLGLSYILFSALITLGL